MRTSSVVGQPEASRTPALFAPQTDVRLIHALAHRAPIMAHFQWADMQADTPPPPSTEGQKAPHAMSAET